MADEMNGEREALIAYLKDCDDNAIVPDVGGAWHAAFQAGRASLAASAGSPEINGQIYTALNDLFTHLGMEGCITADHAFVWDAMTALKRIDGGVHLDNLAVPVDPDAHRDDMLAAVQLLEDEEWAEHFAKTPIGKRLEDQITKLHSEAAANAGSEPVASIYVTPAGEREMDDWKVALPTGRNILYTHPSPPEGMAGWRQGVEAAAALLSKKADDFAKEHGYDDMGGLSFGRGSHADAKLDYHSSLIELADEVRAMLAAPPIPASEAKGASHGL